MFWPAGAPRSACSPQRPVLPFPNRCVGLTRTVNGANSCLPAYSGLGVDIFAGRRAIHGNKSQNA